MTTGEFLAEEGTHIVCPQCSAYIAKLKKSLIKGMLIDEDLLEGLQGTPIVNGSPMKCQSCYTRYSYRSYRQGLSLHTEHGWLPEIDRELENMHLKRQRQIAEIQKPHSKAMRLFISFMFILLFLLVYYNGYVVEEEVKPKQPVLSKGII